ncbi:MAG: beta-N-acetylhexosaminidase, partial [Betaproteobacteria bacterium HGW-Betaproteobacteria-19]
RLAAVVPSKARAPHLADSFALELHSPYLTAREQVLGIAEEVQTGPVMTASTIGDSSKT